ncbi:MAG: cytochrome-c peroxidase [Crocinitomicaceae bacterium]|nr:cytochrome-c peroxidase [Crocinitomicaceae bacterium]
MMLRFLSIALLLICGFVALRCGQTQDLNATVLVPAPSDNPQNAEKIALGRKLFFDKRLSLDGSISCASCHDPQKAFSDQRSKSIGINGQLSERNAPSILNAAFLKTAMFDAHLATLELQAIVPIQEPVEMGHNMKILIKQLRQIPEYQAAAQAIFGRDFDAWVLTRSLAAFERSLLSMNAPFDQYMAGDKKAMSKDQLAGWRIFSDELYCTKCHPAPYFTTYEAANNGLYTSYEGKTDQGRFRIHHDSSDIGKFKIPSLRNLPLTYPYMHDGSINSMEAALEHYQKGGAGHPLQDPRILSFELSTKEKAQLLAFFNALVDTSYLRRNGF